jgi:hypothetical protein
LPKPFILSPKNFRLPLLRSSLTLIALLLGWGAYLWLAKQRLEQGIPWEDSYHHWLVSAHWWETGQYMDPLTDNLRSWLPLYHLFSAAVLGLSGIHNLQALEIFSVLLTGGTGLVLWRQGGVVPALLWWLNPITVLTGSMPVAEPLAVFYQTLGIALAASSKWAALMLSLALLSDRGTWPIVVLYSAYRLVQRKKAYALPLFVLLALWLWQQNVGSLDQTHQWATIDQAGQGDFSQRIQELWRYTWKPLAIPFIFALFGLLQAISKREPGRVGLHFLLGLSYFGLILWFVGTGRLTGSVRYYLNLLPLLLMTGSVFVSLSFRDVLWGATIPLLWGWNQTYLALLPKWVVLNQPSVLAGVWLSQHSAPEKEGDLVTDSPLVSYYSHWPPGHIYGGYRPLPQKAAWIVVVGDPRYQAVYPLLKNLPELVKGDWQQVYVAKHWTLDYGAKPARVFYHPASSLSFQSGPSKPLVTINKKEPKN